MKYAYIAIVAIYLVTFGCNPEPQEHQETTDHEVTQPGNDHVAPSVPEENNSHQAAIEVAPGQEHDVPAAITATDGTPEQVTPQPSEPLNQWEAIAKSAENTVMALMKDEAEPATKEKPVVVVVVENQDQPAPVVVKEQIQPEQLAEKSNAQGPCTRAYAQEEAATVPCNQPCGQAQNSPAPAENLDLNAAMQNMVTATNGMVMVTRQLVLTTQEMLDATKNAAGEIIDTSKEIIETQQIAETAEAAQNSVIETVRQMVSATQQVIAATNEAISAAVETQQEQPQQ